MATAGSDPVSAPARPAGTVRVTRASWTPVQLQPGAGGGGSHGLAFSWSVQRVTTHAHSVHLEGTVIRGRRTKSTQSASWRARPMPSVRNPTRHGRPPVRSRDPFGAGRLRAWAVRVDPRSRRGRTSGTSNRRPTWSSAPVPQHRIEGRRHTPAHPRDDLLQTICQTGKKDELEGSRPSEAPEQNDQAGGLEKRDGPQRQAEHPETALHVGSLRDVLQHGVGTG